ncbi:hypothetical protein D3C87_1650550 [compost metagenome]
MNCPTAATEFFPGLDLATENARQLHGVQLIQRILRVKDDCQAVDGNDLLGAGAFQVAERFETLQFAVLDRT